MSPDAQPMNGGLDDFDVGFEVVKFCAKECELQRSGELSVADMVAAWEQARSWQVLNEERIERLGMMVEPKKNRIGWRVVEVRIGWEPVKVKARDVPDQIAKLVRHWNRLEPAEIFKEFEEIHPFVDGNGRVGQILYNWFNGTMEAPTFAPDFWGDPRREGLVHV